METPLTILYTCSLRGALDTLPRLYTFLKTLRQTAARPGDHILLLDLGGSCAPEVWPCAVTEGRSTLVALDGMGYHAANVQGALSPSSRAKLEAQVTMALVDDAHPHVWGAALLSSRIIPLPAAHSLGVTLAPAARTGLQDGWLSLARVSGAQVGVARVTGAQVHAEICPLPPAAPPDPTIAGVVDFIRSEARYYENRRGP